MLLSFLLLSPYENWGEHSTVQLCLVLLVWPFACYWTLCFFYLKIKVDNTGLIEILCIILHIEKDTDVCVCIFLTHSRHWVLISIPSFPLLKSLPDVVCSCLLLPWSLCSSVALYNHCSAFFLIEMFPKSY